MVVVPWRTTNNWQACSSTAPRSGAAGAGSTAKCHTGLLPIRAGGRRGPAGRADGIGDHCVRPDTKRDAPDEVAIVSRSSNPGDSLRRSPSGSTRSISCSWRFPRAVLGVVDVFLERLADWRVAPCQNWLGPARLTAGRHVRVPLGTRSPGETHVHRGSGIAGTGPDAARGLRQPARQVAVRLHQPRVVGEILAGILLGPSLLGVVAPGVAEQISATARGIQSTVVLGFSITWDCCFSCSCPVRVCAMFSARRTGSRRPGSSDSAPRYHSAARSSSHCWCRSTHSWGLRAASPLSSSSSPLRRPSSIPVITKIFFDLGILHTRFASLMLGAAVLEDILLWGFLAIATAIARPPSPPVARRWRGRCRCTC